MSWKARQGEKCIKTWNFGGKNYVFATYRPTKDQELRKEKTHIKLMVLNKMELESFWKCSSDKDAR